MGTRGPAPSGEARASTLNCRVKPALREALEESARDNNRTLSAEVEHRLFESMNEEFGGLPMMWDNQNDWALMQVIAQVIRRTEEFSGRQWRDDTFTFELLVATISTVLETLKPEGQSIAPDSIQPLRSMEYLKAIDKTAFEKFKYTISQTSIYIWAKGVSSAVIVDLFIETAYGDTVDRAADRPFEKVRDALKSLFKPPSYMPKPSNEESAK